MRDATGGLFDVFEPTYLQAALQKRGSSPNLSHLVFGPIEWRIHGGRLPKALDPLTRVLWELGHPPDGPTNLDLSRYRSQRFLSADEMTKARVSCHLYEGPDSTTALWSITPQIPLSYRDAQTSARRWQGLHPVHDVEPRLGQYIIENTRDCFVGPLEHCGIEPLARPSTVPKGFETNHVHAG
ncbi:hypothetical protein PHLGIDRAFT_165933 [Phlebiopsis gigantea 11061_1 CR5-6]|uniref:Uncharacterized protein n=1 Tax=Phlebiopsis gigantea (strain 11061_1 CR5-6) TaxID=745531 RepID=A0A0C3S4S0_PHLG1|nr:hypothetical protein PHLGIDRAFT_165933 [Phlebiopsis gigantea 11061_1 CR5-6]